MIPMYFLYFFSMFFYKKRKRYIKNTGKKVQEVQAAFKCRTNTGIAWLYFFHKKCIPSWESTGSAGKIFLIAILQWLARDYFVIFPEFFSLLHSQLRCQKNQLMIIRDLVKKLLQGKIFFWKFFPLNFIHSSNIENELFFKIERIVFVRNIAII